MTNAQTIQQAQEKQTELFTQSLQEMYANKESKSRQIDTIKRDIETLSNSAMLGSSYEVFMVSSY